MDEFGTTEEDLALARVVSSRHGQHNLRARDRKAYTVAEVLASPLVCPPLRELEICPYSDGAAAVILGTVEEARKRTTTPIILAGTGIGSRVWNDPLLPVPALSVPVFSGDTMALSEAVMASKMAYRQAGIGPEDLDLVEIPDNSPWHYLAHMEANRLCPPGEAEEMLRDGATAIGGRMPVNPSGGPSCTGECFPALNLANVCEITWQLRGQAGATQVAGAKAALGQTYGEKGNCSCFILKR